MHQTLGVFGLCGVGFIMIGLDFVGGLESIHVDVAVFLEFFVEFFGEKFMEVIREIPQCVFDCEFLLFRSQSGVSLGSVREFGCSRSEFG